MSNKEDQLTNLLEQMVNLIILSKCKTYQRYLIRGYLTYYHNNQKYAVITGSGYVFLIKTELIAIHNEDIIVY